MHKCNNASVWISVFIFQIQIQASPWYHYHYYLIKKHIWFTYLNFMSLLLSFEFKYKYLFSILYVELLFTIWFSDSQSNLLVWSSRSRNLKLCRVLINIFIRNLKQQIMILYIKSLFCSINFTFSTYVVIDKLKI